MIYDNADRRVAQVNPLGNRVSLAYDAAGRQVRSVNPLGNITTSIYDAADRLVATVNPLAYRVSYAYDAGSQQVRVQDANGKITSSTYDPTGRPLAVINALLNRTTQVYDAIGERIALIDANAHRTSFVFDAAGRQTLQRDARSRRTTWAYDQASRQVLRIDARGNRTSYVFDAADRLTARQYADGTRVTFAYDAVSERTLMNDPTGRTSYTYDPTGRVLTVTNPANIRLSYAYDAIGQRRYLAEPADGRFTYVFDVAGRIDHLINPQAQRTSWTYDAADRVLATRLANGTRASYSYDAADQVLRLANVTAAATTISSFAYLYDPVGNRTRVVLANGDRVTWSYDGVYQLTHEQRAGVTAYNVTHAWDSVGNRLKKVDGGALTTYSYDNANQLTLQQDSTGRTTFLYDGDGNQRAEIPPTGSARAGQAPAGLRPGHGAHRPRGLGRLRALLPARPGRLAPRPAGLRVPLLGGREHHRDGRPAVPAAWRGGRMPLTLISHFWDEEFLLPYWLRHHYPLFDHGVLLDYASADRSRDIIRQLAPRWEVRASANAWFDAQDCDREVMAAEREASGWKVVLNTTEFLLADDLARLVRHRERDRPGVAGIWPFDLTMVDPVAERDRAVTAAPLYLQKYWGYHSGGGRSRLLHRQPDGRYVPGRHASGVTPKVLDEALFVLWFGWCPIRYVRERKLRIQTRVSPRDRAIGLGHHHFVSPERLEQLYLHEAGKAYDLRERHPAYGDLLDRLSRAPAAGG
jgi:YD repeat-containing protein